MCGLELDLFWLMSHCEVVSDRPAEAICTHTHESNNLKIRRATSKS